MNTVYIALGTNVEPRKTYLEKALKKIGESSSIQICKQSSIYETDPVGYVNQPDFLNMVIEAKTSLSGLSLLNYLQEIEETLGRTREIRYGPRTIDLDILLYNQENSKLERLLLPHPRMAERAFVLVPLQEIAKNMHISTYGKTVHELLEQLSEEDINGVRKWEKC
jgi:2-amino-4-hydroxy-6-hydroxymethyldihydropteridine diphosphokinase